jgi:hypothetical protein
MEKSLKFKEVKLEKREIYKIQMKDNTKDRKDIAPSATEDCADITSRYERYKKENKKSQFPPIKYEKPPHH